MIIIIFERGGIRFLGLQAKKKGGVGWGGMGWGGVEGSYFMPVEWDPRPAIAQTLAPEQGPQQPSPNQGHRRPYNGTFHLCL